MKVKTPSCPDFIVYKFTNFYFSYHYYLQIMPIHKALILGDFTHVVPIHNVVLKAHYKSLTSEEKVQSSSLL